MTTPTSGEVASLESREYILGVRGARIGHVRKNLSRMKCCSVLGVRGARTLCWIPGASVPWCARGMGLSVLQLGKSQTNQGELGTWLWMCGVKELGLPGVSKVRGAVGPQPLPFLPLLQVGVHDTAPLSPSDSVSLAYQRVQKVDCTSLRPVLILGPLLDVVKEMLVNEVPGKFCRCPLGKGCPRACWAVSVPVFAFSPLFPGMDPMMFQSPLDLAQISVQPLVLCLGARTAGLGS